MLLFFHDYLGRAKVGAGDIEHYALQLADFVTQFERGQFPVWSGQSEYAFNGNVHTLRTAPYHVHFGGLLYLLTGGVLGFVGTVNLEILLSALGGALIVFVIARRELPGRVWLAALWGLLYALAPAIWLPIATRDMLATYLTIPWLPWIWVGWSRFVTEAANPQALLIAIGGTAMLWWIHPPVAAWMSVFGGAVFLWTAMTQREKLPRLWPVLLGAGLLGG